jgi:uncharacterized protein
MTALLDVNVLVALFDSSHVNHEAAHAWFGGDGHLSWATCPITENGCVRVLSNPSYPSVQATPQEVIERLARFCKEPGHVFWPDDISLVTGLEQPLISRLRGSQQITDFYLAALARQHEGRLATFDGSLAKTLNGNALEPILLVLR